MESFKYSTLWIGTHWWLWLIVLVVAFVLILMFDDSKRTVNEPSTAFVAFATLIGLAAAAITSLSLIILLVFWVGSFLH